MGAKYKLDRASCSTYTNAADMYSYINDETVNTKLAVKLDTLVQKDREGNICQEEDALSYNITHNILRPKLFLVGKDVGGTINISMR